SVQHMVLSAEFAGLLHRDHIVRRLHYTNHFPVAARVRAVIAGIEFRQVIAGATQMDFVLGVKDGRRQALRVFPGSAFQVEGDPLRGFLPDPRQVFQLINQASQRLRIVFHCRGGAVVGFRFSRSSQVKPGMFSPPARLPIWLDICSSTLREASLTATRIRSCNISRSCEANTSGSMCTSWSCFWPFILTETIPPPAVASTTNSSSCFCNCSWNCWTCFSI